VRTGWRFDHAERHTVDEDHHIGPAVRILDHRVLAYRQPIVCVWSSKSISGDQDAESNACALVAVLTAP
jgi:hypothetical protein